MKCNTQGFSIQCTYSNISAIHFKFVTLPSELNLNGNR
jgi:hypothetical protein